MFNSMDTSWLLANFATWHILLIQLAASVPLAFVLSKLIVDRLPAPIRSRLVRLLLAVGGTLALVALMELLPAMLTALEAGFVARLVIRALLACAWLTLWLQVCVTSTRYRPSDLRVLAVLIAVALVPPGAYAWDHASRRAEQAAQLAAGEQLIAAERALNELCTLGYRAPVGEVSPLASQARSGH